VRGRKWLVITDRQTDKRTAGRCCLCEGRDVLQCVRLTAHHAFFQRHNDVSRQDKIIRVFTFTFHYQLMHLLIKTLSQFTFKTTHVKNVCDAYLKLI